MSLSRITQDILNKPVPDFAHKRALKKETGYAHIELNTQHPLFNDPLVRLADYNVRGISYYAHQSWIGEGSGFDAAVKEAWVRQDIAERLQRVNTFLRSPEAAFIREALGGTIDVFVTDALRPVELIEELYNRVVPQSIKADHPELTEEEVLKWRDHRMAKPDANAPHASGGAIDIVLSYPNTNQKVPAGFDRNNMETMLPEYYENLEKLRPLTKDEQFAQVARRILHHALMAADSERGGESFVNNGLELWHFGTGDKLSGLIAGRAAYYGHIDQIPTD